MVYDKRGAEDVSDGSINKQNSGQHQLNVVQHPADYLFAAVQLCDTIHKSYLYKLYNGMMCSLFG